MKTMNFLLLILIIIPLINAGGQSSPETIPISPQQLTADLLELQQTLQNYQLAKPLLEATINGNVTQILAEIKILESQTTDSGLLLAVKNLYNFLQNLPHSRVSRKKRQAVDHEVTCDSVESIILTELLTKQTLSQEILQLESVIAKLKSLVAIFKQHNEESVVKIVSYIENVLSAEYRILSERQDYLAKDEAAITALNNFKTQCQQPPSCTVFLSDIEPIARQAEDDIKKEFDIVEQQFVQLQFSSDLSFEQKKNAIDGYVSDFQSFIVSRLKKLFIDVAATLGLDEFKLEKSVNNESKANGLYICAVNIAIEVKNFVNNLNDTLVQETNAFKQSGGN